MTLTKKTLTVAWWEFIERVKTKSFIISLFIMPLIIGMFSAGPAMLSDALEDSESMVILVSDGTGVVFDSLHAALEESPKLANGVPKYALRRVDSTFGTAPVVAELVDSLLLAGKITAAILIPDSALETHVIEYRAHNVSDIEGISSLEKRISEIITRYKMQTAGLDPDLIGTLNQATEMRTVRVTEEGEKETGFLESFGLSYVFIILTMIMVLTSGQMLVRSLVEEKSNRIVEVLVSSCSPMDLMFGKIIGMGMLAFVPIILWAVMGAVLLSVADIGNLPLENLWLMVVYFVLGFLLYASIFVAFGCLTSTEQEAQQMTGYLSMLIMLPIVIAFIASQSPNNPILVVLTMIPFLTPQMMFIRLPIMSPPLWEIALSLGILVLAIIGITWAAARIFRVGILLTGKRPGLDEILRWLRA